MSDVLDLDALDIEPLTVKVGGREYALDVTVGVMKRLDAAREGGEQNPWQLTYLLLAEAGFPEGEYEKLGFEQVRALGNAIDAHFFPNVRGDGTTATTEAGSASPGLNSSPGSVATSGEATSTGMTPVLAEASTT